MSLDTDLPTIEDLTQNQLTELMIFAAFHTVGQIRQLVEDGTVEDPKLLEFLGRYDEYANEIRARRVDYPVAS